MRGLLGLLLTFVVCVLISSALASRARADTLSVDQLVADCSNSDVKCNDDFVFSRLVVQLMSNGCVPDDLLTVQRQIGQWLAQHPEEQGKDPETATADAKAALWPCKAD